MFERRLIDYLPVAERNIAEFDAILTTAEQPELSALWDAVYNAQNDQFIVDATEYGVSRWEKILGIVPKSTDSLDVRRFSVLTRLTEQLPFTLTTLKEKLKSLCGEDGYEVSLNAEKYILSVRIALTVRSSFEDVELLLKRIVPANLIVDLSLKYNQHDAISEYTHKGLQVFTHEQLRNGVV